MGLNVAAGLISGIQGASRHWCCAALSHEHITEQPHPDAFCLNAEHGSEAQVHLVSI